MKQKERMKALRNLSLLTQLGLSLVMPPLLCIFGALYLQKRFAIGDWIVICAIAAGLISSGCTFYRFVKAQTKQESGEQNGQNRSGGQNRND